MASVSFNQKGRSRIYAKFSDGKDFPVIHLGKSKVECIRTLKRIFEQRQYIESGRYDENALDELIQRINDNMKW